MTGSASSAPCPVEQVGMSTLNERGIHQLDQSATRRTRTRRPMLKGDLRLIECTIPYLTSGAHNSDVVAAMRKSTREAVGRYAQMGQAVPSWLTSYSVEARLQEYAAMSLFMLVGHSSRHAEQVVAMGAVPPLVALLISGTADAKVYAAEVLCTLALDSDERRGTIAAAGAIPPLVALLEGGAEGATRAAARALRVLAPYSNEGKIAAAEAAEVLRNISKQRKDNAPRASCIRPLAAALQAIVWLCWRSMRAMGMWDDHPKSGSSRQ